jgi:hypothetical protein
VVDGPASGTFILTIDGGTIVVSGSTYLPVVEPSAVTPDTTSPPLTLPQQATVLLAAGLTLTSPTLGLASVPFAASAAVIAYGTAELASLAANSTFADGAITIQWLDIAATPTLHTWTVAQFKAWFTVIGQFYALCLKVQIGASTTLPTSSVTIA